MRKSYALFDFDGTLRRGDSIVALCAFARKRGLCGVGRSLEGGWAAAQYLLHLRSAKSAKEISLSFLNGLADVDALCRDFCREVLVPQLRPDGLKALRERRDAGCEALLITASPAFYLQPLAKTLGVQAIIGTRMERVEDGRWLISGDDCKGVQKPLRLAEYLAATGDELDYDASWAYGDSLSDLPMLELCAHKIAVNPKPKLWQSVRGLEGARRESWPEPSSQLEAD